MTTLMIEIARRPAADRAWPTPDGLEMARHCIEFVGGRMIAGEVVAAPFDLVISAELPAANGWLESLIADASGPWLAYRTTKLDDQVIDVDPPIDLDAPADPAPLGWPSARVPRALTPHE